MSRCRTLSDAELTDLLKSGDHDAFTEIYERYFGVLYLHALKMLNNEDEVEDILHELFTNLWIKASDLTLQPTLSAYLYRATKNRVIDTFRSSRIRNSYLESLQSSIDAGSETTEETVYANELAGRIEKEVARLPEKMREVFELSRKQQLSHKEIAEQLNISDKTVKKQINNAIKELRLKINTLLFSFLL
jgi:RNA polymerase sigma-70 factor (ECF subfamily)